MRPEKLTSLEAVLVEEIICRAAVGEAVAQCTGKTIATIFDWEESQNVQASHMGGGLRPIIRMP